MYCTVSEAEEYLFKRYSKLPDGSKLEMALQRAFDKIEEIDVRNSGEIANFPRTTETTIPKKIIQANIEEAYSMCFKSEIENNKNVKSESGGDLSVSYVTTTLAGVQFHSRIAHDIMKKFRRKTYG